MKQAGLPAPKFEFTNFFTVIFKRPLITQKTVEKTVEKIQNLSRKELLTLLANKVGSKLVEKVGSKLKSVKNCSFNFRK